jgi:hypothetical protein
MEEELAGGLAVLGCMAGEPVVVEPEPAAAGRSVDPDGVVEVCAKAGAAAKAVATRQAAICFFSIGFLLKIVNSHAPSAQPFNATIAHRFLFPTTGHVDRRTYIAADEDEYLLI